RVDQAGGLDATAAGESGDGVENRSAGHVLSSQIVEDLEVQRLAVPLVGFVEVDGDLDRHRSGHNYIARASAAPASRAPRRSKLLARMLPAKSSQCPCSK